MIVAFAIFAVGVAIWGFAGWKRFWRLFAPRDYPHYHPYDDHDIYR